MLSVSGSGGLHSTGLLSRATDVGSRTARSGGVHCLWNFIRDTTMSNTSATLIIHQVLGGGLHPYIIRMYIHICIRICMCTLYFHSYFWLREWRSVPPVRVSLTRRKDATTSRNAWQWREIHAELAHLAQDADNIWRRTPICSVRLVLVLHYIFIFLC